ncbi:MAG: hypothetical protein M1826_007138 [Phylliscum demangeonii]|nr:MAG: hypothetical protein M1826_007138 [Phylliscum demangeonii]
MVSLKSTAPTGPCGPVTTTTRAQQRDIRARRMSLEDGAPHRIDDQLGRFLTSCPDGFELAGRLAAGRLPAAGCRHFLDDKGARSFLKGSPPGFDYHHHTAACKYLGRGETGDNGVRDRIARML